MSHVLKILNDYMNNCCTATKIMQDFLKLAFKISNADYGYITQVQEGNVCILAIQYNEHTLSNEKKQTFQKFIDNIHYENQNNTLSESHMFNPYFHQQVCIRKNLCNNDVFIHDKYLKQFPELENHPKINDCYSVPLYLKINDADAGVDANECDKNVDNEDEIEEVIIGSFVLATQEGKQLSRKKTIKNNNLEKIILAVQGVLNVEIQKRETPMLHGESLLTSFIQTLPYPMIIFQTLDSKIKEDCYCKYISNKFVNLGYTNESCELKIGNKLIDFDFLNKRCIRTAIHRTFITGESEELYKIKINKSNFLKPGYYDFHTFMTDIGLCICIEEIDNINQLGDYVSNKHQFIANISHDMITPLNGIVGMCELIQDTNMDTTQQNYIQIMRRCSITLVELIHDILDFSKLDMDKITLDEHKFVIRNLTENTVNMVHHLAKEKGLILDIKIDKNVPTYVIGDEHRLQQILLNLISNAIKFTDEGSVIISVCFGSADVDGKIQLKFTVKDTGIGIHKKNIPKLFQSFQQFSTQNSSSRGTGLGLAICKKLIELMDGDIVVESTVDVGSTFTFTITLKSNNDIEDILKMYASELFYNTAVLVLHRNYNIRMDIFKHLIMWKFSPFLCSTKEEAEIYLKSRCVDLIICEQALEEEITDNFINIFTGCKTLFIEESVTTFKLLNNLVHVLLEKNKKRKKKRLKLIESSNVRKKQDIQNLHVLVAEDIWENRQVIVGMLKSVGVHDENIIIVSDGQQAFDIVKEKHVDYFDVIFMDIKMPVMDGLQSSNKIENYYTNNSNTRPFIIATTAMSVENNSQFYFTHGCFDHFLLKPLRKSTLYKLIHEEILG